jgi:hypothetical protein
MKKAIDIVQDYGLFFDRYLGDKLELPYKLETILIPQNEIVNAYTINEVYEKLQYNLAYLYSVSRISENNIPINYAKIAGGNPGTIAFSASGNYAWFSTYNTTPTLLKAWSFYGYPQIDNLVTGRFYPEKSISNKNVGFFITSTAIIALTTDYNNNTIGFYLSTSKVTENSVLTFSNLNSIAYDRNNFIYVADEDNDIIYKYDVNNLFVEDNLIGRKILYDDSVGGRGSFLDENRFNKPSFLNIYEDLLYVVDKNNYCIKTFDLNLNYKKTIRSKKYFENYNVSAFRINQNNGMLYVGFTTYLGIFDKNFNNSFFVNLSSIFEVGEVIKDFNFSEVDKNVFYIITNKNIHKRFISKPQNVIGKFLLPENNIQVTTFNFSYLVPFDNNTDNLVVYGKYGSKGIFYSFLEDSNYVSILTQDDINMYTIDEIRVDKEEYAQDWVFSKASYKLLINLINMRDRIVRRFAGKYDDRGNLLYWGSLYLLDNEVQKEEFGVTLNYFVNLNEIFSNSVFNRSISKFYDFQTHILSTLEDKTLNVWPPLSTTFVIT